MERKVEQPRRSVFSLSLEQALRASDEILELLPIATCVCDAAGHILQYNQRAVELWGSAPEPGQTHDQFTAECKFFDDAGTVLPRSKLAEVLQTGRPISDEEVMVQRADGTEIAVLLNIDPLFNTQGKLIGAINCFQDVTERKRMVDALDRSQRDLREQEERWAATYEHAAIGIVELDAEGRFMRVNEAICSIVGGTREELLSWRLQGRTHPDDRDVDDELYRRQVAGDIGFYSIEKRFIRRDGRVIWIAVRSSTVRDATGHFLYGVRVVQDVTERKEAEDRQKLLIDELNHRVKNTLATVQSLAWQAARPGVPPQVAQERFQERLLALSRTHNLLNETHWEGASVRRILETEFGPYATARTRVRLDGPEVHLEAKPAVVLGMAFHELTTNAAKYGALSAASGRVQVDWSVADRSEGAILTIDWCELGGPV